MKNKKFTYIILASLIGVIAVSLSVYSCEKEVITPNSGNELNSDRNKPGDPMPENYCGRTTELKLVADNGSVVGTALIFNDTKYFYVRMKSSNDFLLGDAALHVAPEVLGFPLDENKNPNVSLFKYKIKGQELSHERSIIVPLSDMKGLSYVAATVQAKALHSTEKHVMFVTTWIDGRQFGDSDKGRFFTYNKQECLTTEGQSDNDLTER